MKKILFLFFIISFTISNVTPQRLSSKEKKAREMYSQARMMSDEKERLKLLKEAIAIDPQFVEAYWLISSTYKEMGDEVSMIVYLDRAAKPKFRLYDKTCYRLGKAYYETGQYEKAKESFNRFTSKNAGWIDKCNIAMDIKKNPIPFKPINLVRVNTDFDDYWPSITADGQQISITVLVGQREGARSLSAQEDIYHSKFMRNGEWAKSESLGPPTNTAQNEGAQSFSVDGRYMFFIACDRSTSLGGCDIYYSIRSGNVWSLAINPGRPLNSQFWETNPSFSPAGDELYFSSNRPGGKGNKDIWVSKVTIEENGRLSFSEPRNLGAPVNTDEDEFSPFIHADNKTLYFSSTGHPGLGGYDIFYARKNPDGTFLRPRNIGYPINSHRDEIGFCVNAQGDKAYLSSNGILNNGRGKDIYEISLPEDLRPERMDFFDGKVYDAKSKKAIQAHIEVFKLDDNKSVFQSVSDELTGDFQAFLPVDDKYGYNIHKKGYMFVSGTLEQRDSLRSTPKVVSLNEIAVGEKVTLQNIFFDFDQAGLKKESYGELSRVAKFLKSNPKVNLEMGGHTDIIGSREYNLNLSTHRAKAVYDHMIKIGVPADRLSYKGYGPDRPIADNNTEEGRAKNRRTEVVVTKMK